MIPADPGGSAYPLTPHAITAIRAVDLMAQVRGKPVVLWPVFVTAMYSASLKLGGENYVNPLEV